MISAMNSLASLLLIALLAGAAAPVHAQASRAQLPNELPGAPPVGSLSLSQIIIKIEGEPDFAYIDEIDWDHDDGLYEIEYRTRDGGKREMKIDPRTGKDRASAINSGNPAPSQRAQ